ncbi:MAG: DUF3108 domain-containing protein [Pseudomonadales bacterium]|nr:DUF3108 domain-containing protein [Pseudomonadales bacterium]
MASNIKGTTLATLVVCISSLIYSNLSFADNHSETIDWIPYKAIYVASLNGSVVDDEGKRELKYMGNQRFRFTAVAENMLFKMEEISEFQVEGDRILPIQYQSNRSTPFKKRTKAVGFDWDTMTLHYQDRKRSGTKKFQAPLFDPLTSVLELAKQVRANATQVKFKEASGRKIKSREFVVEKKETISIPYGAVETIRIKKVDKERTTTIWLAPSLNYIAARVHQIDEDGEEYNLALKKYQPKSKVSLPTQTETPALDSSEAPESAEIEIEPSSVQASIIKEPPPSEADIK